MFKYIVLSILGFFILTGGTAALVLAQSDPTFTLYKESGHIFYKPETAKDYTELKNSQVDLKNHTYIKTQNGYAHVMLPDKSVMSISENAEVQVNTDTKNTLIKQFFGETWHRVMKLTGGRSYQVETPSTVATVRGTKFDVTVDKSGNSTVSVSESKVEVGQIVTENGKKELKDVHLLLTGDEAAIPRSTSEKLQIQKTSEDTKQTNWYKRNQEIDKVFDTDVKNAPKSGNSQQDKSEKVVNAFQQDIINKIKSSPIIQQYQAPVGSNSQSKNENKATPGKKVDSTTLNTVGNSSSKKTGTEQGIGGGAGNNNMNGNSKGNNGSNVNVNKAANNAVSTTVSTPTPVGTIEPGNNGNGNNKGNNGNAAATSAVTNVNVGNNGNGNANGQNNANTNTVNTQLENTNKANNGNGNKNDAPVVNPPPPPPAAPTSIPVPTLPDLNKGNGNGNNKNK